MLLRWIIAISLLTAWAGSVGTALFVALYERKSTFPEGSTIVVLSGPTGPYGKLGGETLDRVRRGVSLYDQGMAQRIIFSGGAEPPTQPIALSMEQHAISAGVPEEAIGVETKARSTLQNALFVAELEEGDLGSPILLVTHRYHLPRANASFGWAGFENITNVAADPAARFTPLGSIVLEGLKWPYNIVRAAAASAADALKIPREKYLEYLE